MKKLLSALVLMLLCLCAGAENPLRFTLEKDPINDKKMIIHDVSGKYYGYTEVSATETTLYNSIGSVMGYESADVIGSGKIFMYNASRKLIGYKKPEVTNKNIFIIYSPYDEVKGYEKHSPAEGKIEIFVGEMPVVNELKSSEPAPQTSFKPEPPKASEQDSYSAKEEELVIPASSFSSSISASEPVSDKCARNGISLKGKVKVVTSFADLKVQVVDSFADIDVQIVNSFPDRCGEWQFVDSFPDFTIQYVTSFPDIKIRFVSSFPGMR